MENFQIGQSATSKRTFTASDLVEFASLTGIVQAPRAVPGPLLGGMFSYLLGTTLPGHGTNYLKQHLEFLGPAFVGDELIATVEIVRLRPEKNLVNLRTTCTNTHGETVCEGEALVFVRDVE
jgi:3-hydroxybutyryl-CoA dehydratase